MTSYPCNQANLRELLQLGSPHNAIGKIMRWLDMRRDSLQIPDEIAVGALSLFEIIWGHC